MLWVPDHLQKKAFPETRRETFSSAYGNQELLREGNYLADSFGASQHQQQQKCNMKVEKCKELKQRTK